MLYKNVDFGATFWCFVLASLVFYSVLLYIFLPFIKYFRQLRTYSVMGGAMMVGGGQVKKPKRAKSRVPNF